MPYLERFVAWDVFRAVDDDIFSLEFDQPWDARAARRTAATADGGRRTGSTARRALAHGFAAVSRGSRAAARRLDADATDAARGRTPAG